MANNYEIPQGLRVYAIGDVHGMLDKLRAIHDAISADLIDNPPEDVYIVYMGDYIDRGPDSKGVIDYLIERRDRGDGVPKTFLVGNHELALFEYMDDPVGDRWLSWGGLETLASYGIVFPSGEGKVEHSEGQPLYELGIPLPAERERAVQDMRDKIPAEHLQFLRSLEMSAEMGDYLFCHAGVRPSVPLQKQSVEDLTFIREPFLSYDKNPTYKPLPKRVVHGHTISELPEVKPHRVGLDTGAFRPSGKLTCGVFEGKSVRFLQV